MKCEFLLQLEYFSCVLFLLDFISETVSVYVFLCVCFIPMTAVSTLHNQSGQLKY